MEGGLYRVSHVAVSISVLAHLFFFQYTSNYESVHCRAIGEVSIQLICAVFPGVVINGPFL